MVKEESVLKHWVTDEIFSLRLVGETGPTQSLGLCHCQTLAICYHLYIHIETFSCIFSTTVSGSLHSLFTGPIFQEIIFAEMSLMTSEVAYFSEVAFVIPIYVASTKLRSAVERIALFSGLESLIRLNGKCSDAKHTTWVYVLVQSYVRLQDRNMLSVYLCQNCYPSQ